MSQAQEPLSGLDDAGRIRQHPASTRRGLSNPLDRSLLSVAGEHFGTQSGDTIGRESCKTLVQYSREQTVFHLGHAGLTWTPPPVGRFWFRRIPRVPSKRLARDYRSILSNHVRIKFVTSRGTGFSSPIPSRGVGEISYRCHLSCFFRGDESV